MSGYATANNRVNININEIQGICVGGYASGAWDYESYSQIVTSNDKIYFTIQSNTALNIAYFIPFK